MSRHKEAQQRTILHPRSMSPERVQGSCAGPSRKALATNPPRDQTPPCHAGGGLPTEVMRHLFGCPCSTTVLHIPASDELRTGRGKLSVIRQTTSPECPTDDISTSTEGPAADLEAMLTLASMSPVPPM